MFMHDSRAAKKEATEHNVGGSTNKSEERTIRGFRAIALMSVLANAAVVVGLLHEETEPI